MPDFIRVKSKDTGAEFTLSATAKVGDDVAVLDKAAVDEFGRPLPMKYAVDLADLTPQTTDAAPIAASASEPSEATVADTQKKK